MSTSVTKCNVKRTLKHYLVCKHLCLGRADGYFHRQWCFLTVNTTPAETPCYICWFAVCLRDVVTSVVPFKGSFHFKLYFFGFFFSTFREFAKKVGTSLTACAFSSEYTSVISATASLRKRTPNVSRTNKATYDWNLLKLSLLLHRTHFMFTFALFN